MWAAGDEGSRPDGCALAPEVPAEERVAKETASSGGCVVQHQRGNDAVETRKAESKNTPETDKNMRKHFYVLREKEDLK